MNLDKRGYLVLAVAMGAAAGAAFQGSGGVLPAKR